jgi:hypothetical protein
MALTCTAEEPSTASRRTLFVSPKLFANHPTNP